MDTGDASGATALRDPEPEPWVPEGNVDGSLFPVGIQVGDAMANSVIVSLHTSASSVTLKIVQAQGADWEEERELVDLVPEAELLQLELDGLLADTAYSVVMYSGAVRSTVTRFRTALDDDGWRVMTFGATSCLGGNFPFPNLQFAAAESFDFFCLLGDTVYADHAYTLEGYHSYYWEVFEQDGMKELTASTSLIATWDDHEVANNWSWDTPGIAERFEMASTAFRAWLPQREGPEGTGVWRKLAYGQVLDVFVLDCRGERKDGLYISPEQLEWLKASLLESTARFKIMLNSVPITDLINLFSDAQSEDRWQGYPVQREELLAHLVDNEISGVLWLSGDFHFSMVTRLAPVGELGSEMFEVLCGPTGSFRNVVGELMVETDQFLLAHAEWNYCHFTCDPGTGLVQLQYIGDDGEVIRELELAL